MPDEVTLNVTTIEENVTVETTAGDVVEIQVVAPNGTAATVTVGATTTGAAGTNASVTNSGTTSAAVFNFTIPQGAAGANGGSSTAWNYRAKTNATSGYPTNGHLIWNNATQLSATQILVSHLNDEDSDIELFLSFFVEGQKLFIQNRDDSSQNQIWEITGTPTVTGANTSTAYYTFPVTLVSSQGAAFTNNHSILFGTITEATNSVTSATTSDGTASLDISNLTLSQAITSGLQTKMIFTAEPTAVGDGQQIIWQWYNGGSPITTAAISSESTGSTTDKLIFKTSQGGSVATSLDLTYTLATFSGSISSLGESYRTASTFTYGTGAAAAHRTALGLTTLATTTPAANVATFLATPTSANLASAVSDETGSGSLVFATSPTLTTPTINSATIGTAATFNATSYTYGTGAAAAMNQSLGTSSVDSRISSLFAVPFQFAQDGFFGRWLTASGNNSFNWILVGTATNWSEAAFNASGFLGGVNLMVNNAAFFYYIAPCAAASIANFNGVVYDQVFNINTSIAAENIFIGIRNAASSTAEVGRRGLYYEAGVDTNWQLLHETSAGVKTKVDTGKSVTLNQIVRVTIKFVSATQTDMIIATSTSTTPVTVSATSGFSCTGSLGLGFWLQSTTANNKYISPMRSTLAWPTSTL